MFERILAERHVQPGVGMEFQSLAALKRCLAVGLGVAILPAVAVRDEAGRGEAALLPWAEDPLEAGILMIWHRKKWLSPALAAFMDLAREELARV